MLDRFSRETATDIGERLPNTECLSWWANVHSVFSDSNRHMVDESEIKAKINPDTETWTGSKNESVSRLKSGSMSGIGACLPVRLLLNLGLLLLVLPMTGLTGCTNSQTPPTSQMDDSGGPDGGEIPPNDDLDGTIDDEDSSASPDSGDSQNGQSGTQTKPPHIDFIIPDRGPVSGNTSVSIMGRGFNRSATLFFGQTPVEDAIVVSPDEIRFSSPPVDRPGKIDLQIETDAGLVRMVEGFTYEPVVEITGVEPAMASMDGGETITLSGGGFVPGALVLIGDHELIAPQVLDENHIKGMVPANRQSGLKDISLHQPGFSVVAKDAFLYYPNGRLDSVHPSAGPLGGGGSITVLGEGFTDDSRFLLGGDEAEVIAISEEGSVATLKVPPGNAPGTVELELIARWNTHRLPDAFTYWDCGNYNFADGTDDAQGGDGYMGGNSVPTPALPLLQGVVPSSGSVEGGGRVRFAGCGFAADRTSFLLGAEAARDCHFEQNGNMAECTIPPAVGGAPGPVHVTATDSLGGSTTLLNGFTYHIPLKLESVIPESGPVEGGIPVLLSGSGFAAVDSCRVIIGTVPVATESIRVLSNSAMQVTLPPGASGPADVKVSCTTAAGDREQTAIIESGFFYQASLRLVGIWPTMGSIAGNTYVELTGTGFHEGMEVLFDGALATEVKMLSGNRLSARTPQNKIGFVDLIIAPNHPSWPAALSPEAPGSPNPQVAPAPSPSASPPPSPSPSPEPPALEANLRLADGFRYYDPANLYGGVWGGLINDSVNVAVINNNTGAPVSGALVIMGDDPDTSRYRGITGPSGRITFSEPGLTGPQTIHGLKEKFSAATIAGFNGANVTLLLTPYPKPPDPNNGGGGEGPLQPGPITATIKGRITGMGKSFPVPQNQNQVRVVRLTTSSYRYYSHTSRPEPGPGATLYQDGDYVLRSRTGMLAVVAVGGLEDVITGEFTPAVMGVRRRLFLNPDQVIDGIDVNLDIPMDVVAKFSIDSPPYAPEGPNTLKMESHLVFDGDDGAWDLFTHAGYQGRILQRVEIPHFPRLEGPLEGCTIMLRAGAYKEYSGGGLGQPYAITTLYDIADVTKEIMVTPWCGVPVMVSPLTNSTVSENTLTWAVNGGSQPPDGQVMWMMGMGVVTSTIWNIHAAGHIRQIKLPAQFRDMDGFPIGERVAMGMEPIIDSRFDFNDFVNSDFYGSTQQSYGMNVEYFYF